MIRIANAFITANAEVNKAAKLTITFLHEASGKENKTSYELIQINQNNPNVYFIS